MSSDKGTVLVTGAAGLIGQAVCDLLAKDSRQVVAIDRAAANDSCTDIITCDLSEVHRLHAIAHQHRITGIVHCGALSGPMVARDNPYAMVQVNIVGAANMLELARIYGARMVYCSSTSVYGDTNATAPVAEDVMLAPNTVYGASKVASEQLVATYAAQFGVDGVSLRLSWVYGPRRSTDCVVRTMIEDAQAGRPTTLPFGQGFYRQYIHVNDAAAALIAALDQPKLPRSTYSVTGGTYLTMNEIAETVGRVVPGARITLGVGPDPQDGVQPLIDISAAERDLGFRAAMSFEDGVRDYADWLQRRRMAA